MKLSKLILITSILAAGIMVAGGCKKETFQSRDTSGLKPPPPEPPAPIDSSLVMFDACDDKTGWQTVGDPIVVASGQKEGAGYIQGTITSGNDFMQFIKTRVPVLDSKLTPENAQLVLWLNIPDVSKLKKDGQIQISSSGQPDSKRYGWAVTDLLPNLKNGWNQLILNFSDANEAGDGGADMSALNFFKIFFWTADKVPTTFVCGIDGIQLRKRPGGGTGPVSSVQIDACDATTGWDAAGGTQALITTGQKEGAGYVQGTIKAGQNFMQFIKTFAPPINTKVTLVNGQLQFWFYVSDPSLLKADGQIQFSSSGSPDNNRVGWSLAPLIPKLKKGWNLMSLNMADADGLTDPNPDLTAMNFFKIFFWTTDPAAADLTFGIDDIKVLATPPPPAIVIDNCDVADGWQTVGPATIVTTGQKEGTGYLQGTMPTDDNFMQFIKPLAAPLDTKITLATGQLQFWLYIPDPSLLKADGQIQFSSSGQPDANRVGWAFAPLIPKLKKGWNLMQLNMSDADGVTDPKPDLTKMNFFKMFFWQTNKPAAPTNFGIDGLVVQRKAS